MTYCRLCLSQEESAADLSEIRQGFPLSVIAMILCPVKIEENDIFSKSICADCLDIITAAFKLRDVSNKTEHRLRSSLEDDEAQVQEIEVEEHEEVVYEKFPEEKLESTFQSDTEQEAHLISIDDELIQGENDEIIEEEDCEILKDEFIVYEDIGGSALDPTASYKVDCQNVHTKKSAVWNYFGYLTDLNGKAVASEKESYYCKLCVEVQNSLKPRYKVESTATSVLFQHLIKNHGISKDEIVTNSVIITNHQPPELVSCDVCEKAVHAGSLSIHKTIEHENASLRTENASQYTVNCFKSSKSLAWDYFGALLDQQGEQIDEFHYYCRLCVEGEGKLTPKYTKNTSTSILLNHLKNAHIPKPPEALRKRKQPDYIGGPNKKMPVQEFTCKICNEQLMSRKNLNRHMAKDHNLDVPKKFHCNFEGCGKSFSMRDTLLKHYKHIHQGITFSCDRCPAVLSTAMSLRRHIDACHLKIKSWACEACEATFTEQKSLKNHFRKLHEGIVEKNISCDHCDLKFTNQWSLSRHMLTHTGEKPHRCHKCDQSYASKGDLVKHLQKMHGELVYKCERCPASFRLKKELTEHYEVHAKWQSDEEEDETEETEPEYEVMSVEDAYMEENSQM